MSYQFIAIFVATVSGTNFPVNTIFSNERFDTMEACQEYLASPDGEAAKGQAYDMARKAKDGSGLEIKVEINCVDTHRDDPRFDD
jgi:hypothetical protein